jgi:hypothetical protein
MSRRRRSRSSQWILWVGFAAICIILTVRLIEAGPGAAELAFLQSGSTVAVAPSPEPAPQISAGDLVVVGVVSLTEQSGNVLVRGTIENRTEKPLDITIEGFSFTDSAGVDYTAPSNGVTTIAAGMTVPWELTVPVPKGQTLKTMTFSFPPERQHTLDLPPTAGGTTP